MIDYKMAKQEWVENSEEERKELDRVYKKEQKWLDSITEGYKDRD